MGDVINYTTGTTLMFTSIGLLRMINLVDNMDKCARVNLSAGLSCAFLTGGLMLRRAYIK